MGAFFIGRLLKKSHQAFVLEHRLVRRSARPSQPKLLRRSRPATPPRGLSIGCDDLTIFEQPVRHFTFHISRSTIPSIRPTSSVYPPCSLWTISGGSTRVSAFLPLASCARNMVAAAP